MYVCQVLYEYLLHCFDVVIMTVTLQVSSTIILDASGTTEVYIV